nr:hypothetical protein [uncultured Sphingobacterium sp.]
MKRITIIICSLLLILISFLWVTYTVRKNRIEKQYVSQSSTGILSIAVDDLLLDNVSKLLSFDTRSTGIEGGEDLIKKIVWNSGISIPARLFLFSTDTQKNQFCGILAVSNYDDCFSFFANQYPKAINFVDKKQGIVSVNIAKQIKVLFDHNHLVYSIGLDPNSDFNELHALLKNQDAWVQIGSFKGFEHALTKKHIGYALKDKSLMAEATVTKHKTDITGQWLLSESIEQNLQVRKIDTANQIVTFWSLLSLNDLPLLSQIMSKYTGFNQEQLKKNYANYLDLEIKTDSVIQKDTSIAYAYDDDFNAIEEIKVTEIAVPYIVHTWKYNEPLAASLPGKMFYQFHKAHIDSYLLNTTSERSPDRIQNERTQHPFYFFIDFNAWPEKWTIYPFSKLKQSKVSATMTTTLMDKNKLAIKGEITY